MTRRDDKAYNKHRLKEARALANVGATALVTGVMGGTVVLEDLRDEAAQVLRRIMREGDEDNALRAATVLFVTSQRSLDRKQPQIVQVSDADSLSPDELAARLQDYLAWKASQQP